MQYYMIEWDHEDFDEPWRVYLELDDHGALCRRVDAYRMGLYEAYEDLNTPPMDPREIAGGDGNLSPLNRIQFQDIWDQSQQTPSDMMGLFY